MLKTNIKHAIQRIRFPHQRALQEAVMKGAGNTVLSNSEDKENDEPDENAKMTSKMKVIRQFKMMRRMEVEGMLTNSEFQIVTKKN